MTDTTQKQVTPCEMMPEVNKMIMEHGTEHTLKVFQEMRDKEQDPIQRAGLTQIIGHIESMKAMSTLKF